MKNYDTESEEDIIPPLVSDDEIGEETNEEEKRFLQQNR